LNKKGAHVLKIALTFDVERDLPNVLDTHFGIDAGLSRILEMLENFDIKGTFFCTGNVVERFPERIKSIEQKGHEIACHGLNHERLSQLSFDECKEIISQSKEVVEHICKKSKIIGFRAPYLSPPKFLFKVLNKLGFKYDSSIKSRKNLKYYQINGYQIQEFHPSDYNVFLRFPLSYTFLRKWIFKKKLIVLYFHPWEAINVKNLLRNHKNRTDFLKNIVFRPDRWLNTGDSFLRRISKLIKEAISKKAEFVTLNQLIV